MTTERFICIDNEGYPVALEMFATYETIADDQAEKRGLLRVIDESGEDYLYPKSRFVPADASLDNVDPRMGRKFSANA